MPYTITHREQDDQHEWVVACARCDLGDPSDRLLSSTISLLRRSYGEGALVNDANILFADEIAKGTFDLDHLTAAIRRGLPNPASEGDKPSQLTNYRSQSAEMVAKGALAKVYGLQYPAAPQEGCANPNQPILGYDGWGIIQRDDGDVVLCLIQVKATDTPRCPPPDSATLAVECRNVPKDVSALCRALTMFARLLRGDPLCKALQLMLAKIGANQLPAMCVAPTIVRGVTLGNLRDLEPVRAVKSDIEPIAMRGLVISIGVCLEDFGYLVMSKAREAA